jgi:uncharacterized membrane protein YuzA (DUF378 family)
MSGMKMCSMHMIAWWLMFIGAVNWGLVGLGGFFGANWNVVHMLLGAWPQVEWIVYILVGVSAIAMLFKDQCGMCKAEMKKM